ncbi:MAG: hypothetical protein ABA06_04780 [Parcubacteria bacterium C7867-001]|nr:MAG: hypothetical protein ABA06_04780 [Parcubacteria bacterium C7867-001]
MDNPDRVTYFAATDSRGKRVPFGLKQKDRSRHMYVIGKTGMGKSTLLENMAIQDIRNGEGMAFIDPHGSAVETLLSYIPQDRINDVVYFAPFDLENPIAFNVMEDVGYDKRHLVVSGLMATFKKIWVDAWSARMEYILSNTLLALLEYPGATLLGVNRMYTDKVYRKAVVENIKDPVVKDFWIKEFMTYTDRYTQEATPAIQNKIGQFTSNPLIRNIIGQEKSSFDIRDLMDRRKILIVNLSKGLVGDTNMKLLGSMITTRLFLGAMSRANLDPVTLKKSPPFYFYVDEFQNFANETFAEILSEARKYNLNLIIAHQYVEQMEEEVRAAVFGNVGTTVCFRVGPFDAEILETIFTPEFLKEDLVNLGFAQIYLTLMIDGVGSRPFSAVTIPPIEPPPRSYKDEVIASSRKQFASPRANIENAIFTELQQGQQDVPAEPKPKKKEYGPRAPKNDFQDSRPPRPRTDEQRPRPPQQEQKAPPPSSSMTKEDLRAIVQTLAQGAAKNKERKADTQTQALKGVLGSVITDPQPELPPGHKNEKPQPPRPQQLKSQGQPQPQQKQPQRTQDQRPPQQKQEKREPQPPQNPQQSQGKKPFEVPEEVLKDVFKEDI